MTTPEKPDAGCAHPSCACPETAYERDGRRYCSASCAEQASSGREQSPCGCGHARCSGG